VRFATFSKQKAPIEFEAFLLVHGYLPGTDPRSETALFIQDARKLCSVFRVELIESEFLEALVVNRV